MTLCSALGLHFFSALASFDPKSRYNTVIDTIDKQTPEKSKADISVLVLTCEYQVCNLKRRDGLDPL